MATKGTVSGVIANMVTLVVDGPVAQNEICYISTGGDKLMAEVIKVVGTQCHFEHMSGKLGFGPHFQSAGTLKYLHVDLVTYYLNHLRHQLVSLRSFPNT